MEWEALYKMAAEDPMIAGAIATAVGGAIAFFRPIMRALRAAAIRRIDRAWPEDGGHEEKVRKAVDTLQKETLMPIPRSMVETAVRRHKSISPEANGTP